jgi:hypothetical protein
LVAGGDHDAGPGLTQRACERVTEAAVAAGDDRHPSVEAKLLEHGHVRDPVELA